MASLARRLRAALVGLSVALALPAAVRAAEGAAPFPASAKIVAIGGSITEIVYALGEQDRLIARDSTSVYPPAALKLPDVGYMRQLSPESVLSVDPAGILALQGSGPQDTIDVLGKAGVPFIEVPDSFDSAGILEKIRVVGRALGVEDKAAALAAATGASLEAARKETAAVKTRKRVLFVLSMQGGKILASGAGTAADGIVRLAGGVNAVAGYSGYKQLSDEAVVTASPDVVLMMDHGGPGSDADPFSSAAIAATPAGIEHRLIRMDGAYLLGFGPRTADAVRDLAASLYGRQAGD